MVARRLRCGGYLLGSHQPVFRGHGAELDAGQCRRRPHFVVADVGGLDTQQLLAGAGEAADPQLIAHAAGGHEHRRLFAGDGGRFFFERVDGGILAIDVVAHLGFRHRLVHRRGGAGHGVGAEVRGSVWKGHAHLAARARQRSHRAGVLGRTGAARHNVRR